MRNYPIELSLVGILLFIPVLVLGFYGDRVLGRVPAPAPLAAINLVLEPPSPTPEDPTLTPTIEATSTPVPSPTATQTLTPTPFPVLQESLPTDTPTPVVEPTDVPSFGGKPTPTETIGEMMKTHIVFYLIQPVEGHTDACGNIQLVPIISRRLRSGDKLYDVQVALNMLFNLKRKVYIKWYNALWDTDLRIDSYQYIAQKDYMIIDFGGYLPAMQLSNCDKHGIREQIWTTFFHYGIKEKTFKINGVFLIDQLNRKTK